jgi:hypothetical protein
MPAPVDQADATKTLLVDSAEGKASQEASRREEAAAAPADGTVPTNVEVATNGPATSQAVTKTGIYRWLPSKRASSKKATKETTPPMKINEQRSWLSQLPWKQARPASKKSRTSRRQSQTKSQKPLATSEPAALLALEATPAATPWRHVDDFEAAASGDMQTILEFLPGEALDHPALEAAPEVAPKSIAVDAVDAPAERVVETPAASSSCFFAQCMAPKTESGSELQLA